MGWWVFEQDEQPPRGLAEDGSDDGEAELTRLAELGVLEPDELEAMRLRAENGRPLIGTPGEHWYWSHPPKQDSVERRDLRLWDLVRAVTTRD